MSGSLLIGLLASSAGVNVETIRYYQRRGLLPEPPRPLGGVRRYGEDDLARLQFIRRAQAVGFTLDEVAGLLAAKGSRACLETRQLTEHKLAEVRQKIAELHRLEAELQQMVVACDGTRPEAECPTLTALERRDRS